MKRKLPSILILAATALGFAACAPLSTQQMQPRASVEQIERDGAGVPANTETIGQALSGRNAVDYANDRGNQGWGGGRGWGWGGPLPRF